MKRLPIIAITALTLVLSGCGRQSPDELGTIVDNTYPNPSITEVIEAAIVRADELKVIQDIKDGKVPETTDPAEMTDAEYSQYVRTLPVMTKFDPTSEEYDWDSFSGRVVAHVGNTVIAGVDVRLQDVIKECGGAITGPPVRYPDTEESYTYLYVCKK